MELLGDPEAGEDVFSGSQQELEASAQIFYQSSMRPLNVIQSSAWSHTLGLEALFINNLLQQQKSLQEQIRAPKPPSDPVVDQASVSNPKPSTSQISDN